MTDQPNSANLCAEKLKELLAEGSSNYLAGHYSEAESAFEKIIGTILDEDRNESKTAIAARIGAAKIYYERAHYDEALEALTGAANLARELSPGDNTLLVYALSDLGLVQLALNDQETSEATLRESLAIAERIEPKDDLAIAQARIRLGTFCEQAGKLEEAEFLLTRALGTHCRLLPLAQAKMAEALAALAELHVARGKFNLAEALLNETLTLRKKIFGNDHAMVARTRQSLLSIYRRIGKLFQAHKEWPDVISALERTLPKTHPLTVVALNEFADTELCLFKIKEAAALFEKAVTLIENNKKIGEPIVLTTYFGMGVSKLRQGQYRAAEEYSRRALALVGAAKKGSIHLEKSLLDSLMTSLLMQGKLADMAKLVPDLLRARQTQQADQYAEMLDVIYKQVKKKI